MSFLVSTFLQLRVFSLLHQARSKEYNVYIVRIPFNFRLSPWNNGQSFQTDTGPSALNCPAPISNRNTGSPISTREMT
jgi:hypothetical protein